MNFFKNASFRASLIVWFIIIIIISSSSFFFLNYKLSEDPINSTLSHNLNSASKNKALFFNNWIEQQAKVIKSFSQSNTLINGKQEEIEKEIKQYFKIHKNFYSIVMTDSNGNTIYDAADFPSVDVSDRDYFIAAKNKKDYISEKMLSKTDNHPIIVVSSPLIRNGEFLGALIGVISLSEISNTIGASGSDDINESYIVDTNGNLVVSSKQNISSNPTPSESRIVSSQQQNLISEAVKSGHSTASYINRFNKKVFGSYIPLPYSNWVLVNEIDISKDMNTIKKASIEVGILTLFVNILIFIPLVIFLSRRLAIPIKNIGNMVYELSMGNFDKRINYISNNEVGMLARTFNTMADKLQSTYNELNERIIVLNEQTEEIKMKNLKLEQVIEVNKTILEKLEDKNKQLGQENKLKAEFLANMSHEFRTPMNSIIGYTEMILDGNDGEINEEQRKDLTIILKSAEKLLGIINDVLDLSKIEAGKMTYQFKKFNLVDEVKSLVENINVMAQSKGLDLIFEYSPNIHDIYSDPVKISHILSNILSNAVKFTDTGYVKISLETDNPHQLSIHVTDTGIGIPEEEFNKIFDEFRQIDGSSTRKYGGTGLGLTIAKGLAEGIGGRISVKSKIGAGSTFTLTIPTSKVSKEIVVKKQEPIISKINLPKVKNDIIIVITQNTSNYNSIEAILSHYDFKVISTAYDNAIQTVKTTNPSCIFIDIDLPCTNCNDGWLALADLKHDRATSHIPKIVVSTQNGNSLSYILGASDYLIKPFNTNDVLGCLNRCLIKQPHGYIMLVEEDKETIDLISLVIRKSTHFNTLTVTSAKDIFNILGSSRLPSLIILNSSIASIKPIETINAIIASDPQRKIPLIVIAEKSPNALEQEYLRQNADKVLYNNEIRYSKLVNVIKKLAFENKYL